jgi:hypothetical protein
MKHIPILFSTPMVQAILEGRKTMTRRVVNEKTPLGNWEETVKHCRYGKPEDVLWVRETWKPKYVKGGLDGFRLQYPQVYPWFYSADGESENGYGSWKPSIHMPKEACRIFLKVTDVRVERLHDISEEDALSEGVKRDEILHHIRYKDYYSDAKGYGHPEYDFPTVPTATESFISLWMKINGEESWGVNPWVWVVSFERIERPLGFFLNKN